MISDDFETKLDEALNQFAGGDSSEQITACIPETDELLQVARRLRVLAPAPMPNLANGRRVFLTEAAVLGAKPASAHRWPWQPSPRRVLAFAGSAVFVLLVGVMITFTAGSLLARIPDVPAWWSSSTPTMHPTYTATPTQISLAPVGSSQFRSSWVSQIASRPFPPSPNPAPLAAPSRQTSK